MDNAIPDARPAGPVEVALRDGAALVERGRLLDAVELLHSANAVHSDPRLERRLAVLRHAAFAELAAHSRFDRWPGPVPGGHDPTHPEVPDLSVEELNGDNVRRAISAHGSVRIPRLLDLDQTGAFIRGIDHVMEVRAASSDEPYRNHGSWFAGLPLSAAEAQSLGRPWIAGAGGFLSCDSPKLLELMFRTYEQVGLRSVLEDYLGERPVLSANKCTMRKVPTTAKADWHQDGAFLGSGIRALNVWVALTDCGVDSPGMDLVPRRFESVQETGTGGAIFDWAVGPDVVASLARDAPVVRPAFEAGDALLFDDLFLHRTAVEPTMTRPRYAIESWFFAKTAYPEGQVPLVW